jgi:hypothetical protein
MFLLIGVGLAFLVALVLGGRPARLGQARFRASYLILLALILQILIFSRWWQGQSGLGAMAAPLYVVSMVLLIVAVWLNRRVPGMALLGVGLALNAAVITANGGHMPASFQALQTAGLLEPGASFETLRVTNSSLITEGTPLWFLGDIFALPKPFPLANVFSVGDILIAAGASWFILAMMLRPPIGPKPEPSNL